MDRVIRKIHQVILIRPSTQVLNEDINQELVASGADVNIF